MNRFVLQLVLVWSGFWGGKSFGSDGAEVHGPRCAKRVTNIWSIARVMTSGMAAPYARPIAHHAPQITHASASVTNARLSVGLPMSSHQCPTSLFGLE